MKSSNLLAALLLVASSLFFTRCTADHDFVSTPKEIITEGEWAVQTFMAGGDKTAQYTDYSFSFRPDGTVMIEGDGTEYSGTWKWTHNVQSEILSLQLPDQGGLLLLDNQWTVSGWGRQSIAFKRSGDVLTLHKQSLR